MDELIRLLAGEPNPLTPAEMLAAGIPAGSVVTADTVNAALDQMRANGPLPPHVAAALDQIAAARRIDERRPA